MCLAGLLSSLACCFSRAACSLCCAFCPSCRNSTSSRISYVLVLVIATFASLIALTPFARDQWAKIKPLCEQVDTVDCNRLVGYLAVYRIMFAVIMFFLLMAILMLGVKSSRDKRADLQNGFWGVKILIIIATLVSALFIPQGTFEQVWMYFGLIGGFAFIIMQLVVLIDFAYNWNEKWVARMEDEEGCGKWFSILLSVTIFIFLVSLVSIIIMYVYYGNSGCGLNKFFISFNLILCVGLSIVSILPVVQDSNPSSGLLQSSVMTLYMVFITWSAMTSSTNLDCNPELGDILSTSRSEDDSDSSSGLNCTSVVSVNLWILVVMYQSVKFSNKIGASSDTTDALIESGDDVERGGQKVHDNEKDGVAYNYSVFHLVLACAALYIMMSLTDWLNPKGQVVQFERSDTAMWVKIISTWCCASLYGWTLVAPLIFTNRSFQP